MRTAVPGAGMSRMGSGTSWQPDATPIYALVWRLGRALREGAHATPPPHPEGRGATPAHPPTHAAMERHPWELMLMGYVFVEHIGQGGPRGISRSLSQNWFMGMAHRTTARDALTLRLMLSLDPATVGNNGVPQLLQTGEGLVDRQHPHDLFMEIGGLYSRRIHDRLVWTLYLAPVGEPALGPVAYLHRISAAENPQTPLGHHLQDSTHIAYGVITGGIQSERWKLEASWFNAREPDDRRWAFDPIGLNSPSVRLWYHPSANWSLQVSRGWLKAPEAQEPGVDIRRTTASVTYVRPRPGGYLAASFVWGRNDKERHGEEPARTLDSFGLEATWHWARRNHLWGRIEALDRDELFPGERGERSFFVGALTLGYSRDFGRISGWDAALGGSVTFHAIPSELRSVYGDFPVGVRVFLRFRPKRLASHP